MINDTHDGTGVRDCIHVVQSAKGPLKAFEANEKQKGFRTVNLSTGQDFSVLDTVRAFGKASGREVAF